MLDKMKQLYEMQKQAREMKKVTEAMKVEKTGLNGGIQVIMNGQFQIEKLEIQASYLTPENKPALEKALKNVLNEATEDVAKQSAAQAMDMMKNMNIKFPF